MSYFTIDDDPNFHYHGFFDDFGPPSILQLVEFYRTVQSLMESNGKKILHFFTAPEPTQIPNSVMFIAFFRMFHLKVTPEEAFKPFGKIETTFKPFRDASTLPTIFDLKIIDCLRGIYKAANAGWFDIDTFDSSLWQEMEKIELGDMNWIIPGKILALASPYSRPTLPGGYQVATPQGIIPHLQELEVNHIVRLNKQFYDASDFKDAGFNFTELYFVDGTVPPDNILAQWLEIAESDDVIAVHCKAGLGRTGTLIGCYMIKNHGFTACEAIGWLRVCRPGSVIGPQQLYLVAFENKIKEDLRRVCEPSSRPQTAREVHVMRAPRTARLKFRPMQGFPLQDDPAEGNKLVMRPKSARRSSTKKISRPFKPKTDNFASIKSLSINSFHPQPRKLNQRVPKY